jgi:hypothetical protein
MKIVSPQIAQMDTDYEKYKKNQCNPCNPWTSIFPFTKREFCFII